MRLIDADTLMEILTTAIRNMKGMAKFIASEDDPEIQMEIKAYTDIADGVKDMPTIDPERKTGRWIVSDDKYWHTCPFCNADIDVSMGTGVYVDNDEVNHVNYCPNCGAKLEAEGIK